MNQGCPASPQIYCYTSEIMTHLIYQNPNIKGLDVHGMESLLSQFADDTSAFLKFEKLCLESFTNTLECVERQMGLKVSYDKTTIHRIGSLVDSDATLYTQKELKWSSGTIKTLGVAMECNGKISDCNYVEIIEKINKVCNIWINRNATLCGKVLIVNSLIGSLFVHKITAMLALSKVQIKEIESIIRKFIWNDKKPKIRLHTLYGQKEQGGLRLVNIRAKQDVIRCNWIFNINTTDNLLKECAFRQLSPVLRDLIWKCNLNEDAINILFGKEEVEFWSNVLKSWSKIHYHIPSTKTEVLNEIIWYNTNIRISNKPILWEKWFKKGILKVGDIIDEEGNWRDMSNLESNWLETHMIRNAIPKEWVEIIQNTESGVMEPDLYERMIRSKDRSRKMYNMLINEELLVLKYFEDWGTTENIQFDWETYIDAFKELTVCTKVSKFRDFQYRLLLGKIINNKMLYKWKIVDSEMCTLCNDCIESTTHLLVNCKKVKPIYQFIKEVANTTGIILELDENSILCSKVCGKRGHIFNFICTVAKQFIYRHRCMKTTISVKKFISEIEMLHRIEWEIAKSEQRLTKHEQKWSPMFEFEEHGQP